MKRDRKADARPGAGGRVICASCRKRAPFRANHFGLGAKRGDFCEKTRPKTLSAQDKARAYARRPRKKMPARSRQKRAKGKEKGKQRRSGKRNGKRKTKRRGRGVKFDGCPTADRGVNRSDPRRSLGSPACRRPQRFFGWG